MRGVAGIVIGLVMGASLVWITMEGANGGISCDCGCSPTGAVSGCIDTSDCIGPDPAGPPPGCSNAPGHPNLRDGMCCADGWCDVESDVVKCPTGTICSAGCGSGCPTDCIGKACGEDDGCGTACPGPTCGDGILCPSEALVLPVVPPGYCCKDSAVCGNILNNGAGGTGCFCDDTVAGVVACPVGGRPVDPP
jgi:hypothetical protein